MRFLRVLPALVWIGCQSGGEQGTVESDIVNTTTPFVGSAATPLPPLAAHGRVVEGLYNSTARASAHSAQFMDGVDLASPPLHDPASTNARRLAWADALASIPNAGSLQPPKLASQLHIAIDSAELRMASLSADVLDQAAWLFSEIPGFTTPVKSGPIEEFTTWTPPRARWLDSQWAFAPDVLWPPHVPPPETHFHYPTPGALALSSERGARLYCAARQMARQQQKGSLGEKVLIPLSILGQDIDIGVFEPFAYINQPEYKHDVPAPNDGVQAFDIPIDLGVKISPLRPFLPPLRELRYPLVLTAADSEVVTDTARGLVYEDQRCFGAGGFCIPIIRNDYQKRFKTVAHVDSATSVGRYMTTQATFPLFWAGPLLVNLNLGFGASVGTKLPPLPPSTVPSDHVTFGDDRLLVLAAPPAGWPASHRTGGPAGHYHDGYWRLPQSYFNPDPGNQFYDVVTSDGGTDSVATVAELAPDSPFRSAVLADDDHHISPTSELAITGGLQGVLGFSASFATIRISASGNVTGIVGLAHDIRDAVSADTGLFSTQPVVSLLITPTTYANANLVFTVEFQLHIPLPWDSIDVDYFLVNKTIPIASDASAWSEEHRVRLGTASTLGPDATKQPAFTSHAGTIEFPSFPESVDTCLADPAAVPGPPPVCESTPATGVPKHIEACLYVSISPQIDPCLDIPVATNFSTLHEQCEISKLTYLCAATSKEQVWGTDYVLAHRIALPLNAPDGAYSEDLDKMRNVASICAEADRSKIDPGKLTEWFEGQFHVLPCDAAATLMNAADVVTERPSDVGTGSCPQPTAP
jgi:hypothetical protein